MRRFRAVGFVLALAALTACASEEPEPPLPRGPGGAWVERRGAGLFQHLPDPPRPREPDDDPAARAAPSPRTQPVDVMTWQGEKIHGELSEETDDELVVLQAGTVRRIARRDVRSVRLYPRNVRVLEGDAAAPASPPRTR